VRLLDAFLRRYARGQARDVAPWIVGRRVLDLGTGEGYVPAALARGGARVVGADIGRFRRAAVPYVVYDGGRLPFHDGAFDTTLMLLMLHHAAAPERVLDEAVRVTRRRLVVTESVYRTRLERAWLDALDGRVNRLRHDGAMPAPLAFRTPDEWRALFASRALRVLATRWLGPWWERLVHHPLLFVLERAEPAAGAWGDSGASVARAPAPEQRRDVGVALQDREPERRLRLRVPGVELRPGPEERLDHLAVPERRGPVERRRVVAVADAHVGPEREEVRDDPGAAREGGHQQGRPAEVVAALEHAAVHAQEPLDPLEPAVLDGGEEVVAAEEPLPEAHAGQTTSSVRAVVSPKRAIAYAGSPR
jgi:SAM-dependent methyltransferase